MPDPARPVPPALAALAAVSGVVLVTLLAVWAAGIGPSEVLAGDGLEPYRVTESTSATPEETESGTVGQESSGPTLDWGWLRAVSVVLMVAFALWLGWLLFLALRAAARAWAERTRPEPAPEEVAFDVLEHPEALADELAAVAEAQREALAEGSPRNAIVRCWREFEEAAERVGLARRPWQTPAEFTLKVLDLVDADPHAVTRLAELYREARFSRHDLGEADRAAAREALDEIHHGLAAWQDLGR